jgi:hypothetical protein
MMCMRIIRSCLMVPFLLMAGCASLPFLQAGTSAATPRPQSLSPALLSTATAGTVEPTSTPVPEGSETPTFTPTSGLFTIDLTPVPTDTALPTLELPTEVKYPPNLQIWDGLPTYLAESKPGYYFRLHFDPAVWALTTDQFGFPALGHRQVPGCMIAPTSGRGMALNATVDHDVRHIGAISYQVDTAYVNGVRQFINYSGGEGNIYTAFGVTFQDQADQCLTDAETVLAGLRSVAVSQATPIATP